jgi:hypothetical protein
MHAKFFGDSYDIVKRFFCRQLRVVGYRVFADPMFTPGAEITSKSYHRLLGTAPVLQRGAPAVRSALFIDPDTGVRGRGGPRYVSFSRLAAEAEDYALVFAFDQSFSRGASTTEAMARKQADLSALGCCTMYYSSHAHFLFVAKRTTAIQQFRSRLVRAGIPKNRLITGGA